MKTLKLMTDYFCNPLWENEQETPEDRKKLNKLGFYHVENLEEIGLKPETIQKLRDWADLNDSYLNMDYPPDSIFDIEKLENNGLELWKILNQELKGKYKVIYHSHKYYNIHTKNYIFRNINEYPNTPIKKILFK